MIFIQKQLCGKLEAAANFCFEGVYKEEIPWGNGHINDTYRVTFENEQGVKKVLYFTADEQEYL